MSMLTTLWLALAMMVIAIINPALMAWLWRFPMVPDPTGRTDEMVSSAPRFWVNVHRTLGYLFALTYLALLTEMVPRIWEFRVSSTISVLHGVLGFLIGAILIFKVLVIRKFKRLGGKLPWIGGTLAVTTLISSSLAVGPAWKLLQPLTPLSAELKQGRNVVASRCNQCHGASVIVSEREDAGKWDRITREMQRFSQRTPGKTPITERERQLAAAYLARTLGETDEPEDDSGKGRGRGNEGDAGANEVEENENGKDAEQNGGDSGQRRRRRGRDN